jgi:hypothetical protein
MHLHVLHYNKLIMIKCHFLASHNPYLQNLEAASVEGPNFCHYYQTHRDVQSAFKQDIPFIAWTQSTAPPHIALRFKGQSVHLSLVPLWCSQCLNKQTIYRGEVLQFCFLQHTQKPLMLIV